MTTIRLNFSIHPFSIRKDRDLQKSFAQIFRISLLSTNKRKDYHIYPSVIHYERDFPLGLPLGVSLKAPFRPFFALGYNSLPTPFNASAPAFSAAAE